MSGGRARLGLLLIVLVTAAVYAPSLRNGFTYDDLVVARPVHIDGTPNTYAGQLRPLGDYFSANYWAGYQGRSSHLYRPVTILSYALTNALCAPGGAIRPFPHHLINVLLHLGAVVLVFRLVLLLTAQRLPALLAAAVFGLHAIHSEVVAGIVGRAELFAFDFGALGLLLHLRGMRVRGMPRAALLGAGGLATLAALCSKESAIAWVAFTPLYALLAPRGAGAARGWRGQLGATALTVGAPLLVYLALRAHALADMPEQDFVNYLSNPLYFVDAWTRVLTGTVIWGYGLFLCALPFTLVSDYGPVTFPLVSSLLDPAFVGAALALVGGLVLGLALVRRQPVLFLAMACFLGFGFLTSNLPLAIGTIFGERLYYTPSFAIALLVAWLWPRVHRGRALLGAALAVWLVTCAVVILQRNEVWRDDDIRVTHDVEVNPRSLRLLDSAANYYSSRGEAQRAEILWRDAIGLEADYANARVNYGAALGRQGRYAEAEEVLLPALRAPAHLRQRDESVHFNLAAVYEATGRPVRAWNQLRQVFALAPELPELYPPLLRLARARLEAGLRDQTVDVLRALAGDPERPPEVRRQAQSLLDGR